MIDAPFCNAVSLLTGFTGWVLAVWSFLRPEGPLRLEAGRRWDGLRPGPAGPALRRAAGDRGG